MTVKVNYTRIPLLTDANGVPTGLETNAANFKSLPSRGVRVRLWEGRDEVNPDGSKTRVWINTQSGSTDSTGSIEFSGASKDTDAFVEVLSYFPVVGTGDIRIVGDPAGIDSSLPIGERPLYALRKGLDGASPAGNPVPGAKSAVNTTVTFNVGTEDKWWLTLTSFNQIANAVQEVNGSGSRILAILDSIYTLNSSGGFGASPGALLDLHYRMGVSHPRGSFIEYDRTRYPGAFDSASQSFHYFGTIKGGTADDDAYDEGVLFPMLIRNGLWSLGFASQRITAKALPDLMPDNALVEALPFAQAANLLKSPYLADTYAGGSHNTDIRTLGSVLSGPRAAPAIVGFAWDMILKANALPNPGVATDWAKINPAATTRFFLTTIPADLADRPNVFVQIARLKEAKSATEPVDLAAIFTDSVITAMAAPYNITWPRPTTGIDATAITDWGKDPNSLATPLPAKVLSMSKAVAVDGSYPNSSSGEAFYAKLSLSKDTAYDLHVTTTPAVLPAGTKLEVHFYSPSGTWEFTGTATPSSRIVLRGNKDTALNYLVRVGLQSPDTLAPDITATVSLDLAN
ncbi:MAG: hypothetical protein IPL96_00630 [Holophagaceae bacterium]|nr:hypothetical protein [Holophagaceae bacterium]